MKLIKTITYYFDLLFPKIPRDSEEARKRRESKIVSLYAQGSISLHRKKYVTTDQLEARVKRIAEYNFLLGENN